MFSKMGYFVLLVGLLLAGFNVLQMTSDFSFIGLMLTALELVLCVIGSYLINRGNKIAVIVFAFFAVFFLFMDIANLQIPQEIMNQPQIYAALFFKNYALPLLIDLTWLMILLSGIGILFQEYLIKKKGVL